MRHWPFSTSPDSTRNPIVSGSPQRVWAGCGAIVGATRGADSAGDLGTDGSWRTCLRQVRVARCRGRSIGGSKPTTVAPGSTSRGRIRRLPLRAFGTVIQPDTEPFQQFGRPPASHVDATCASRLPRRAAPDRVSPQAVLRQGAATSPSAASDDRRTRCRTGGNRRRTRRFRTASTRAAVRCRTARRAASPTSRSVGRRRRAWRQTSRPVDERREDSAQSRRAPAATTKET